MSNLDKLHNEFLEDNRAEGNLIDLCEECGQEIFEGEDFYDIDGFKYCENCIHEVIDQKFLVRA